MEFLRSGWVAVRTFRGNQIQMKRLFILLLATALACSGPAPKTQDQLPMSSEKKNDPHSFAQTEIAQVAHLDWDAQILFEEQVIEATASWTLTEGAGNEVIFDTYDLDILEVTDGNGNTLSFEVGEKSELFGSPLIIQLEDAGEKVSIRYRTSPGAKALQWTDAEQTADRLGPFLYTQSQAILARTWVPCQDGPGIRFTYEAHVQVPKGMLALMSASNPMEVSDDGSYSFSMPQPIPSYLLALSAGHLAFKEVGARTGVYAEPSMVDTCAWEFADMEAMMVAAEELYGPYEWGRYDLIVLPPSFPFGGMENPRLTFATPTILAGDRSLVSLVAHELAHSWSGNLVTNSVWDDFWLNEGFTVYFEMRIMEAVYGREYSEMLALLSHTELLNTVEEFMESMPDDTRLKLDLKGRNPDDGVTAIPYDKGYHFLRLMEETIGRERFDAFLKNYFQTNRFKVMDTERFVALLKTDLLTEEEYSLIGVDNWIYAPGLPANVPVPNSDRFEKVDGYAQAFLNETKLPEAEVTETWSTHEWLRFLRRIKGADVNALAQLDAAYSLTRSGNAELAAQWFENTLSEKEAYHAPNEMDLEASVTDFLTRVGRRKFLMPIYSALLEGGKLEWAQSIYEKARPGYHAVSRESLDELLLASN